MANQSSKHPLEGLSLVVLNVAELAKLVWRP